MKARKEIATRFLGRCQYCGNEQKLVEGSKPGTFALVLHGYKRPGTGSIHGNCPGVGYDPWEVTCQIEGVRRLLGLPSGQSRGRSVRRRAYR